MSLEGFCVACSFFVKGKEFLWKDDSTFLSSLLDELSLCPCLGEAGTAQSTLMERDIISKHVFLFFWNFALPYVT